VSGAPQRHSIVDVAGGNIETREDACQPRTTPPMHATVPVRLAECIEVPDNSAQWTQGDLLIMIADGMLDCCQSGGLA
jgi:hypothetical protein